ncbi:hypothetical protein SH601_10510 [Gracilibacillus sp. S3-1-1]|uniref:Uncharacterized protein n=1 Tax=Gracilibacillus pellucidus TaxID=3095368 RepID=A0ACC6M6A5_9BACI|nr:hypothetical protein [Gracilibacillus sp. S3-1-1]MDX8046413.1 hypothetical protein [Gracilibacillus sp. S3-1-1]
MFKDFKNKRYWILMPPFSIIALLLFIFLPNNYKFFSPLVIIIFWIVYYVWNYLAEKKNNPNNPEELP